MALSAFVGFLAIRGAREHDGDKTGTMHEACEDEFKQVEGLTVDCVTREYYQPTEE